MHKQSDAVLDKINAFFVPQHEFIYKKGEAVMRAEDSPAGIYFLRSGFVQQYIISPSGETFMVHVFKPGSFFPLMWAVNDTPNVFHYDAITTVHILRAPKDAFLSFIKSEPDVLFYATQRLAAGLSGLVTRVGQLVLDDAYTKIVLLVLYYADNFGEETEDGIVLRVPLTHREIAAWVGTTRETASLQIETLIEKGLLASKGRLLVIKNRDLLVKEIRR